MSVQREPSIAEPTEVSASYWDYEPQAFVADPESDGFVSITKGQLEDLRAGKVNVWDDLAAKLDASGKDGVEAGKKRGYLAEIEPSRSNEQAWDEARKAWAANGAIEPPFEKDLLCRIARTSGVLQECIRAYCTVIEGFGHSFRPVLDLDADSARDQVKWTMWMSRVDEGQDPETCEPTEAEIDARVNELRREIKFQKMRADRFFRNAARIKGQPVGFVQFRQRLRQDYEVTGEWYFEILRDKAGNPRRMCYLPSVSMRQMPLEGQKQKVSVKERVDDFTIIDQTEYRQFRRYLQVDPDEMSMCYFKDFGDPRVLSARSGKYYDNEEALEKAEPGALQATEVLVDGIPDPETPYGVPRWTANSPAIGGSRKAEEVNFSYFDNKTIPPFLVLVSGGRLSSQAQERIKTYLRQLKGSDNFHKLLVLEAAPFAANMPGQPPQRVQIEVVPLIKFLQDDGLFLKYLAFNDTRIGANFATPPMLRGRSEEYTRATARETLRFFEKMVAQPERLHFDEIINTKIMLALGLTLITYESNGADTSDPEMITKMLDVLLNHGAIVPDDARQEAERLLRRELPKISDDWVKQPLKMTIAAIATTPQEMKSPIPANESATSATASLQQGKEKDAGDAYIAKLRGDLRNAVLSDLGANYREELWTDWTTTRD